MRAWLFKPIHSSSLAAYRILFGLLGTVGLIRFWYMGWIERCFVRPEFLFKYYGFEWIKLWPGDGIYVHFAILIAVSICLTLGLFTRWMSLLFFLGFSYIELLDQSNYLNHYYLVMLLAFINIFLPLNALWSLDGKLGLSPRREFVPAWTLNWLRFQVGTVYFFAGLAKFGKDWLLEAQPLNIWLTAHRDLPVIGSLFEYTWSHFAMSWAGFIFDSTIVFWMLIPATRRFAYLVVIFFHAMTFVLFPIGMFPFIMVSMALVFFPDDWPAKLLKIPKRIGPSAFHFNPRPALVLGLSAYALIQVTVPFRHLLYPGDVLWNEEGMRFSWKVMVREKNGEATFRVRDRQTGAVQYVSPSQYLLRHQENEMSTTPDMILQFAHHLQKKFAEEGKDVAIFAETMASFNGRTAKPLIDEQVDLTAISESFYPKTWVSPEPGDSPHRLKFHRAAR